jgi:sigma-E factor negative regulatory protein RseB
MLHIVLKKNNLVENMSMKVRGSFRNALLGGIVLCSANCQAGEQRISLDWLKVVAFAAHQTEYSGVFVYQQNDRVETSRITHIVEPDSEYEKLESLDGPKREILIHHGHIWSYNNHKLVQLDSRQQQGRFPSLLPDQLTALNANYQILDAGMDRVAGYNTRVILFQPLDDLRYARKIWAHADTGLILKAAVLDSKKQVIEQYAFTQLQIGGNIDRSPILDNPGLPISHSDMHSGVQFKPGAIKPVTSVVSGWIAAFMPPGFVKTLEIKRTMHDRHAPVTQIVYSDGLASISIFIEPTDSDEDDTEGLKTFGAANMRHKIMDRNLITVVGEVPPRTVLQVIDSVRYSGR